ncbi:MAG: fructose-1,6-bisphosphatase [Propionivibrio sp.]|jgi:fructose-1,6-bisphosphatase-3|uniref:fructose-1,6-bisphosphatase n=1 Tax=Propionivibrio sp. TaxID=2212460 RepID=UPI001B4CAC75|nr:fructose-1,6-bisphosphatase [Propionivibrio sp.]MBP7202515.1 fructose-1,6-bisphosphatase [Propionivibrio sp.]
MQTHPLKYLQLLSEKYPSIQAASTAIINFSALLQLPKGTEHFLSDIHGEHEAFQHVVRNGAGSILRKIDEMFSNSMSKSERRNLATLIYYPELKAPLMLNSVPDKDEWSRLALVRLVKFSRRLSSKYRREAIRKFLPPAVSETIEELLYDQEGVEHKAAYYQSQIDTIVTTGSALTFITCLAELIRHLAVERLHVIGDIYDRGPGAHIILDMLMEHPQVDIQWGNHDILWMGAAAGSEACIANVIRASLRYGNMETLENGYGISILPLASFALETYKDDPCELFIPKVPADSGFTAQEIRLMAQMQKAMAIIQFKVEAQVIKRRPHYQMDDRLLLDKIDYERGVIKLNGNEYPLLDTFFPTIDPKNPEVLTAEEQAVMERLVLSFTNSKKLQQHVRYLFSTGSIYLAHDGNLLYHGCIAMDDNTEFRAFNVDGKSFAGKAFLDRVDRLARQGYFATDNPEQKRYGMDVMWFLWCAPMSPLFGKEKMTTFERYFIADKATHAEKRNAYYALRDTEDAARKILKEFGLDPDTGRIVNGHVPVKVVKGERPIKANGRLIVIDGGFSRAYQKQTGIAGYTLISNSRGLLLAAHQPFESTQKAVSEELDIDSEMEVIHSHSYRMRVRDTDRGREIQAQIDELQALLHAYREGLIKEHSVK